MRDTYSLGYNVARAYTDEEVTGIGVAYLAEVYEQNGWEYFPVIAPSYLKNDICFLMGVSDVFGLPVCVVSDKEEVTRAVCSSYDYRQWLVVDFARCEFICEDEFYDIRYPFEMCCLTELEWLYVFGYDCWQLEAMTEYCENVYVIRNKADTADVIALMMRYVACDTPLSLESRAFSPVHWLQAGDASDCANRRAEWIMQWHNLLGYETDLAAEWEAYEKLQFTAVRDFPPCWEPHYDREQSYWKTCSVCYAEQTVTRLYFGEE